MILRIQRLPIVPGSSVFLGEDKGKLLNKRILRLEYANSRNQNIESVPMKLRNFLGKLIKQLQHNRHQRQLSFLRAHVLQRTANRGLIVPFHHSTYRLAHAK